MILPRTDLLVPAGSKQPAGIQALQLLIDKFRRGEFRPGQKIRESVLAEEFGLSRHALREALNQIVGWDILEYTPYLGYRVREFTIYDFLEWREMRAAIEPFAARRLAMTRPPKVLALLTELVDQMEAEIRGDNDVEKVRRYDLDFHLAVVENCGNRRFNHMQTIGYFIADFFYDVRDPELTYQIPNSLNQHLPPGYSYEEYDKLGRELTIQGHRDMLNFIVNGQAKEAEELFREHCVNLIWSLENIIKYLSSAEIAEMVRTLNRKINAR